MIITSKVKKLCCDDRMENLHSSLQNTKLEGAYIPDDIIGSPGHTNPGLPSSSLP